MHSLKEKIKKISKELLPEIIDIRRHLHAYPELSNQENNTAKYIAKQLEGSHIPCKNKIFKTGILGIIKGKNPDKKVIAIRADMDALPVQEENEVEYRSVVPGIMHACGHDVHMASLLGTAKMLNTLKEEFEGTVKLIFQPAEEKIPGGAKFMIEEGVLENPRPQIMLAQHVCPEIETGKIGIKSGKYMASTDEINILVKGKGGHAAMPNALTDTVAIAALIVTSLQQIVSRNAPVNIPTVLSFGRFIADGTYNVIPDEVKLKGTFRTFNDAWRKQAHQKIEKMAQAIARGAGAECEIFIHKGYPELVNSKSVSERTFEYAKEYLGAENVVELDLRTTSEDFAYFAKEIPSCFYRLGIRNEKKGINHNLHTSRFNVDETCLEIGMGLMTWIILNELILTNN